MNITFVKQAPLVVGGPPRADLLPPEVAQGVKAKLVRRNLVSLVVLVVLVLGAGTVGATYLATESADALEAANTRTMELIAQQAKYQEVRQISGLLATTVAAREVGTSTEIDWKAYTEAIQSSLPAGTTVTNFSAETATPLAGYAAATVPLQGERMGKLTFTASSASLPSVDSWLKALTTLPGHVDATPGSVVLDTATNAYTVNITMHINEEALANRFVPETEEASSAAGEESTADAAPAGATEGE